MTVAIDPTVSIDFVTNEDKKLPKEEQTTWLVRPLTERELRDINKSMKYNVKTEEINVTDLEVEAKALRLGLTGWKNFLDPKGKQVEAEFTKQKTLQATSIDRIPPGVRTSLANYITSGSRFTEDDAKN